MDTATKLNFRALLADQISGSSADVEFCIQFAEDHQAKGDIEDAELLRQIVKVLAQDSNAHRHRRVSAYNEEVAEGIEGLQRMGCWAQLGRIAVHALQAETECLANDPKKPHVKLVPGQKVRLAVLKMGSDSFKDVFTKEFLDKMGFNPGD